MRKQCKIVIKYGNGKCNKEEEFHLDRDIFLNKDETIIIDEELNHAWLKSNPQVQYKIISINGSN